MSRCKICDRVPATEEQYRNMPEGEGEHLCWGEWSQQQCQSEAVDWHQKYMVLLANFKSLDSYNSILYRVFHLARRMKKNGFGHDTLAELYSAVLEVERFENELYVNKELRPPEEDAGSRHLEG